MYLQWCSSQIQNDTQTVRSEEFRIIVEIVKSWKNPNRVAWNEAKSVEGYGYAWGRSSFLFKWIFKMFFSRQFHLYSYFQAITEGLSYCAVETPGDLQSTRWSLETGVKIKKTRMILIFDAPGANVNKLCLFSDAHAEKNVEIRNISMTAKSWKIQECHEVEPNPSKDRGR